MKKILISLLPDGLLVGGATGVSYGAWLIYAPAGYIVAGVFLLLAGRMVAGLEGK